MCVCVLVCVSSVLTLRVDSGLAADSCLNFMLVRSTLLDAVSEFKQREPRGEIVLLVAGYTRTASEASEELQVHDLLRSLLQEGSPGG